MKMKMKMRKILLAFTVLLGLIVPLQAFAESSIYATYIDLDKASYAIQVLLDQQDSADIKYSYASDLCRLYEHSRVNVSYDEKGVGTFSFEDITGTIDTNAGTMTIQKR